MKISKPIPDDLNELSYPEQLTLWSMRFWSDGFRQNYSPYEPLREAYSRAKCPEVLLSLDNLLSLIVAGHSRLVDIRCPCCRGISQDEWRVLQSLALAQSGNRGQIASLISHFLAPTTVRIALTVIFGWGEELENHGLIVPLRSSVLEALPSDRAVTKTGVPLLVYTARQKSSLH